MMMHYKFYQLGYKLRDAESPVHHQDVFALYHIVHYREN